MNKYVIILISMLSVVIFGLIAFAASKDLFKSEDERSAKWDEYNKRFK